MVKAVLDNIAVSGDGHFFLALLKTEAGDIVPIAIDQSQAQTISWGQQKEAFERPLSHDLMLSIIEMLSGTIVRIEVTELRDDIFFAKLVIENRGIEFEIDARPSDALALAVRVDVPLYISEQVIEQSAFTDDIDFEVDGPGAEA